MPTIDICYKNNKKLENWTIVVEKSLFLQPQTKARELSSVGSEHRPYKAGVVGSSPTVPTKKKAAYAAFFSLELRV